MLPPVSARLTKREMQRRLAGRDRERADAAFEFGDALFKNRGGRIGDPAVAIAFGLEVEQGGAMIGAVEGIGGGLIDRNGDGLGGRIGVVAGVNCNRLVAHRSTSAVRVTHFHHAFYSPLLC